MEGVRELNYNYGTYINFAAVMAEQIFEHTYSDDERDGVDRSRVAVFFTDGKPDGDGEGLYDLADETLQPAYRMKNNEKGEVSIYSVGVFESADASKIWHLQDDNTAPNEFMHMLSSNFPTAYAFESAREVRDVGATSNRNIVITDVNSELLVTDGDGNVSVDPSKSGYYLTAINALELVNVFESISSDVSSGGASVTLDAETIVRDVISGNWEIDVDEDEIASEQINVYTMQYVAEDAWEATADRLTPVVFGNTVSVTGFDFSENYVGVDIIQGVSTYRGKKLVIEIPIRPTEDNMGGLRQPTNVAALSGIYYDSNGDGVLSNNERLETFAVPAVDIPTTVAISKIIENGDGFAGDNEFSLIGSYYNATFAYTSLNGELGGGNYLNMNKTDAEDFTLSLSEGENHSLENVMVGEILKIKEINAEDYQVKVEININPNNDEIEGDQEPEGERWYELAADADGYYNVTVEAGLKIRVTNTLLRANLTITKEGADPNDENQIFLFRVSGPNITMDIAIVGNDSVTIEHLPVGEYTVQELIYWSWRYDVYSVTATNDETVTDVENGIKFDLTVNDESVTFSNTRTNIYWLSGDSYVENWWIGDNDIIVTKRKESD